MCLGLCTIARNIINLYFSKLLTTCFYVWCYYQLGSINEVRLCVLCATVYQWGPGRHHRPYLQTLMDPHTEQ